MQRKKISLRTLRLQNIKDMISWFYGFEMPKMQHADRRNGRM